MSPVSKAQQKATAKYAKVNYDRIEVKVLKGKKDKIKTYADSKGESVNGFINRAIDETLLNKLEQEKTIARINVKPQFEFIYANNIYTKNNHIIIPIKIKNIGLGVATQVSLKAYEDNTFFECPSEKVKHNVCEYLSAYHALPGEEITFSISCANEILACNLYFTLSFSDIAEREYEQKIRIQYGSLNEKFMSQNYSSYDPVCVHDIL